MPEIRSEVLGGYLAVMPSYVAEGIQMAVTEAGRRELFKVITERIGVAVDETIGGLALIVLAALVGLQNFHRGI